MDFEGLKLFVIQKTEQGFPPHLYYHNAGHIFDVYRVAQSLALLECTSEKDTRLLLTAVLYHDLGFLESDNNHEEISCRMAREDLPRFGFTLSDTDRICALIMATRIPQNPLNLLEEIICDADLDYLGREDFTATADKLFAECRLRGLFRDKEEWDREQVRFLKEHRFFTAWSVANRAPIKAKHLEALKKKLSKRNRLPE